LPGNNGKEVAGIILQPAGINPQLDLLRLGNAQTKSPTGLSKIQIAVLELQPDESDYEMVESDHAITPCKRPAGAINLQPGSHCFPVTGSSHKTGAVHLPFTGLHKKSLVV
jgi:hypothetical protein